MSEERWWDSDADRTEPDRSLPHGGRPVRADSEGSLRWDRQDPTSSSPGAVHRTGKSGPTRSGSLPGGSWTTGRHSTRSLTVTALVVAALVVVLLLLRATADDRSTVALEPALAAVGSELPEGSELRGEDRPTRGALGLDDRFTEPRVWRSSDTQVVAYARASLDGDADRIEADGAIADLLLRSTGPGSELVDDSLEGTAPLVRVIELRLSDSTVIVYGVGVAEPAEAVLVVSASGAENPEDELGTTIEELVSEGLRAIG